MPFKVTQEKIQEIRDLLQEAGNIFEFGGGEDSDGALWPGHVDFKELEEKIVCVLEDREYRPPTPEPLVPRPLYEWGPEDPHNEWVALGSLPPED